MSVDMPDDEPGEPPDLEGGETPGRFCVIVIIEFYFANDGKVITTQDLQINSDEPLSDQDVEDRIDQDVGPLYARLTSYPRLFGSAGGTILWRVLAQYPCYI